MKLKYFLFLILFLSSCSQIDESYLICDSNNELCNFFEIKHPDVSQITDDNALLSVEDLNTYRKLSEQHNNNPQSNSVFDIYTEIFIPRFSYHILDVNALEKLWFGLALYPLDYKNDLLTATSYFYDNPESLNHSLYGECRIDKNSYLDSENSKIYNCSKDGVESYDFWVSDEQFMWRMKCVWEQDKFEGVNIGLVKAEIINSSDTCRNSFESFKSNF